MVAAPLSVLPDRLQATFWPGGQVPSDGHLALWGTDDPVGAAAALRLPPGEQATLPTVLPRSPRARTRVATANVPARVVPILPAVRTLAALPPPDAWPGWQRPGDSLVAWSLAAKLALELVAAGHVVPILRPAGPGRGLAEWHVAPAGDGRVRRLADAFPFAAHALLLDDDEDRVWSAEELIVAFCDAVADGCVRAAGIGGPPAGAPGVGHEQAWPGRWRRALTGADPLVDLPDGEGALLDDVSRWSAPLAGRDDQAAARLCVRLDTPEGEDPGTPWPLAYLLQAADDPSLVVPAEQVWDVGSVSMKVLGRQVGDPQETLVRGLAEAARLFSPIDGSLSEARPSRLELDPGQAAGFLTEGSRALAAAGLGVMLPAELTAQGARKLRARLRVGQPVTDPGQGITSAGLTEEKLAKFRWEVALGDETLTPEEFAEIAALKQPLVRWKGQWVRVDPDEAVKLADLSGAEGTLSGIEALSVALTGEREVPDLGTVEVVAEDALAALVDRLRTAEGAKDPRLDGVEATLRDYQSRGVAWLQTMAELGLGSLLADDMGLGKTLQTIGLLTDRGGDRPHLVVCPTSVVGNWERELARFAPKLPVQRHHGGGRADTAEAFAPGAVTITSYPLLRRDADLLADVPWDVVVLDEAQQVKNQASQGARAARRLAGRARLALTGTPVENRLSELWSIMEFLNPGLLGPFARFKERYAVPVERWRDPEAAAGLRRLVAPFMVRRMKTDPAVAADLPPKQEATIACTLTREQATLYQAAVAAILDDEGLGEGIERRGRVLKLLTVLKQICNHPAQYLGEPGPLRGRSGKLVRATEMLAEVADSDERALVFTQYRQMGDLLAHHLQAALGLPEVPFLHGGVRRAARDTMVEAFQTRDDAPPILIVSLKAGGTGLNLTRATHVVHYDRWWNPAVEDQATDRTYRIGQTRGVNVHKLVTAGTLEERIADLLEDKRGLADAVVGAGETWLTELSDAELRDLVSLSAADLADVEEAA